MAQVFGSNQFRLIGSELLHARASASYFEPHLHDTFVITLPTRGSAVIASAAIRSVVHEGDVSIFNPFEVHEGGDRNQPIEYEVLYVSPRFVCDALPGRRSWNGCPLFGTRIVRRSDWTESLLACLRSNSVSAPAVESALQTLMRQITLEPGSVDSAPIDPVRAACELMHESFTRPIDSQALADAAGLSKFHFIRLFRRATGLSPQAYLRQLRLARARDLICRGEELAAAAVAAGFADQAHMTRAFRECYGYTPGQLSRDLQRGEVLDVCAKNSGRLAVESARQSIRASPFVERCRANRRFGRTAWDVRS